MRKKKKNPRLTKSLIVRFRITTNPRSVAFCRFPSRPWTRSKTFSFGHGRLGIPQSSERRLHRFGIINWDCLKAGFLQVRLFMASLRHPTINAFTRPAGCNRALCFSFGLICAFQWGIPSIGYRRREFSFSLFSLPCSPDSNITPVRLQAGAGTIQPAQLTSHTFPPLTMAPTFSGTQMALLPTYTPTGTIKTLFAPTFTAAPNEVVGDGWNNNSDTMLAYV